MACGAIPSWPSKGACFPPTAARSSAGVADAPHPWKPAPLEPVWIKEPHVRRPTLIKTYTSCTNPGHAELLSYGAVHPCPQDFLSKLPCQLSPDLLPAPATQKQRAHLTGCLAALCVSQCFPGPSFWSCTLTQKTSQPPSCSSTCVERLVHTHGGPRHSSPGSSHL